MNAAKTAVNIVNVRRETEERTAATDHRETEDHRVTVITEVLVVTDRTVATDHRATVITEVRDLTVATDRRETEDRRVTAITEVLAVTDRIVETDHRATADHRATVRREQKDRQISQSWKPRLVHANRKDWLLMIRKEINLPSWKMAARRISRKSRNVPWKSRRNRRSTTNQSL